MLYILLAISTLTATGKSVIFKKIGVSTSSSPRQFLKLNALSFPVAAIIALATIGFHLEKLFSISSYSFIMAVLFALTIIFTYLTQIKAMSLGNASSTMIIYSCGFLIPIFYGAMFLNETVSLVQIFAIGLLILSLFLIINPEKHTKISFSWILFSVLSMTGSGMLAVLQKIHQASVYKDEFSLLLSWEFLIAGVIIAILTLFTKKEENTPDVSLKKDGLTAILNGGFLGVLNMLNLRLSGKLPAVILFPVYNIGSLVLSGIICAILFKEKNTKKGIAGFIIGCIAILLIGLF